ncbi:hypothetical protein DICPUDRAFT_75713, partial [Dictyostelium purpureum]
MAAHETLDWRLTLPADERNEKRGKIFNFLLKLCPQYTKQELTNKATSIEETIFNSPQITTHMQYLEAIAKKIFKIHTSFDNKTDPAAATPQPQTPITPITPMTPIANQQPATPQQQQSKQQPQ